MNKSKKSATGDQVVTLRAVAQHIGLTPSTVSAVLNDAPAAKVIPQRTKDRVIAAARELNYRPNFFARTLRKKRTYTIGVITEEIGDAYGGMVISGKTPDGKFVEIAEIPGHPWFLAVQYHPEFKSKPTSPQEYV